MSDMISLLRQYRWIEYTYDSFSSWLITGLQDTVFWNVMCKYTNEELSNSCIYLNALSEQNYKAKFKFFFDFCWYI